MIKFCVKISLWSVATTKILQQQKLFTNTYVEKMEEYDRYLCLCGFHMYHDIWEASVCEMLDCKRELGKCKGQVCCGGD